MNFFTIDPRGLVGMSTDYMELSGSAMATMEASNSDPKTAFNSRQAFLDEMRVSQDSLRTLADETGGFAAVNRNSFASTFDRIVQANSRYYVMGYYPPTHPRDGRFQVQPTASRKKGQTRKPRGSDPFFAKGNCNPCLPATGHSAMNACMADGSVRHIVFSIDQTVFTNLCNKADGNVLPSDF